MSEITPNGRSDAQAEPSTREQLVTILTKVVPLVDSVADKIRFAALLGLALVIWIGVWLYFIKSFSLTTSLIVVGISLLPILVLLRFWWSLEEIKALPDVLDTMVDDAKSEIQTTVKDIQAGNTQKLGFFASAKSLWSIGSLLGEARELLGSYVSIATLVNPFSLMMGVLSLLFVMGLIFIGLILAFFAF